MRNAFTPLVAALVASFSLLGCGQDAPKGDAPKETAGATSGSGEGEALPEGTLPKPQLAGFFEPGNFGTLTVGNDTDAPVSLSIRSVDVRVEVEGRLARTIVEQVFHNHTPQQAEGSYEFVLPEGAAISRLAMDVEGKMMEGELVERERARKIYEQIVRQKKDPALLEWQGGNRFKTQIFPIPANGDKRVILAYEQILPRRGDAFAYAYALPNLSGETKGSLMGRFSFQLSAKHTGKVTPSGYPMKVVQRGAVASTRFVAQDFVPQGPVKVKFAAPSKAESFVSFAQSEGERFFLLDFMPDLPGVSADAAPHTVFVVDTSASVGAVELGRVQDVIRRLVAQTPGAGLVNVVYGDRLVTACADSPYDSAGRTALLDCLAARKAGGGTDLSALLVGGIESALAMNGPAAVVVFTDGTASLGELDGDLIRAHVEKRIGAAPISVHTVAVGHAPDEDYLGTIAEAGQGHALRLTPAADVGTASAEIADRLRQPLLTQVKVAATGTVEGLTPQRTVRLARNDALAIMGRLDAGESTITITGQYQGRPYEKRFGVKADPQANSNLLRNFWARAVIDEMQRKEIDRDKIVKTSQHYGVMSRYTSFIVLENDEAYKRFNVERRKEKARQDALVAQKNLSKSKSDLATLLAAGEKAVKRKERSPIRENLFGEASANEEEVEPADELVMDEMPRPARKVRAAAKAAPSLLSELGAVGDMDGVVGGAARLGGTKRAKSRRRMAGSGSSLRLRLSHVSAGLDRKAATRVLRRRQGAIKYCFERSGGKKARRRARPQALHVEIQIGASGRVGKVRTLNERTRSPEIARCVMRKVKRFRFPTASRPGARVRVWYHMGPKGAKPLQLAGSVFEDAIKALEKRRKSLTPQEKGELLELYRLAKKPRKARTLVKAWKKGLEGEGLYTDLWTVVRDLERVGIVEATFIEVSRTLLSGDSPPADVAVALADHWVSKKNWRGLSTALGKVALDPVSYARILLAVEDSASKAFKKEIDALLASPLYTPLQRYQVLTNDRALAEKVPAALFQVTSALLANGDPRPEVLSDAVTSGVAVGQVPTVVDAVVKRCPAKTDTLERCIGWLGQLAGDPTARDHLKTLTDAQLVALGEKRKSDMGNVDLIVRYATLLRKRGEEQAARRIASEMVEFAPHDYGTRQRYAKRLADQKEVGAACAQYASAVQLNPSERDTFRTMMKLRRAHPKQGNVLGQCIVDGVSKLPVRRDVSLVLTWEDPSADVDLHIHEAGGAHVSYKNRESKDGGLLYYDITDGYGPEIYVMGSGPKGEYRLTLVYYNGQARNLKGTLTILRDAGSAKETRERRPFVLQKADRDKEIPIGSFTL